MSIGKWLKPDPIRIVAKENKSTGVFIVGVIISFIWSWNVKKIAFGSMSDRIYYSLGAGLGSLFGLVCSVWVLKLIQ